MIKVLFIHQTKIGSLSATGQLLSLLLDEIEDIFQVYEIANNIDKIECGNRFWDLQQFISSNKKETSKNLTELICDISPQVIIFRPDDKLIKLSDCVLQSVNITGAKFIGCVMDSWEGSEKNIILNKVFKSADSLWFISEGMEKYYKNIYEFTCETFISANGVDMKHFQYPKAISKIERGKIPLNVIFTGSVNLIQTYEGLEFTADSVNELAPKVKLKIFTRQYITELAKNLSKNSGVTLCPPIEGYDKYLREINNADVLLIPYGWNKEVLSYLRYSFGNKIPEYLACGVPIVVLGSEELNSVKHLLGTEGVKVITSPNAIDIQRELKEHFMYLLENYDSELEKSQRRKKNVLEHFSIQNQRNAFKKQLLSI
jgi:glycosyltransferase involved in cell wall biosynthesis